MRVIRIRAKCTDAFSLEYNNRIYNDYIPDFVPNKYGAYIDMKIDADTGKILNWVIPNEELLEELFNPEESKGWDEDDE